MSLEFLVLIDQSHLLGIFLLLISTHVRQLSFEIINLLVVALNLVLLGHNGLMNGGFFCGCFCVHVKSHLLELLWSFTTLVLGITKLLECIKFADL